MERLCHVKSRLRKEYSGQLGDSKRRLRTAREHFGSCAGIVIYMLRRCERIFAAFRGVCEESKSAISKPHYNCKYNRTSYYL